MVISAPTFRPEFAIIALDSVPLSGLFPSTVMQGSCRLRGWAAARRGGRVENDAKETQRRMLWKMLLTRNIFQKPIDEVPAPLALLKLLANHAEAPFPPLVVGDGVIQLLPAKIRPEAVADVDLRIGKLPEEKIADPELSACADQQVGIGDIGGRKVREISGSSISSG